MSPGKPAAPPSAHVPVCACACVCVVVCMCACVATIWNSTRLGVVYARRKQARHSGRTEPSPAYLCLSCMSLCVHVCTCMHTHMRACVCTFVCACVHACVHVSVCACMRGMAWRGMAWRGVAWRGVAGGGVCTHSSSQARHGILRTMESPIAHSCRSVAKSSADVDRV